MYNYIHVHVIKEVLSCHQFKEQNNTLKVIDVHDDLRKMFITLVWNDQQSFYLHHFHITILPVIFCICQISIHFFIINHVLTL